MSYGVYLLHKLVLHVVSRGFDASALNAPGLQLAAVLAGTVSVAALSFRYFETPILALKERFR